MLQLSDRILELHRELAAAPSLRPSARINALFTELVELTLAPQAAQAEAVLQDPAVMAILPHLRQLCSDGEFELELAWAQRIIAHNFSSAELETFPYYRNYQKLTDLEYQAFQLGGRRRIHRGLFVGSGPLPLSAILLAKQYGVLVDGIDTNDEAVRVSAELIGRLGAGDLVRVNTADAQTFGRYGDYDVIFLAALVGADGGAKTQLLTTIRDAMRPGALLVVRSAHGLRRLLYPEVAVSEVDGLAPQAVIHPLNEVVNSVVLFEKPHGDGPQQAVVLDKTQPGALRRFQDFCQAHISEVYGYAHNPAWHSDIDRAQAVYTGNRSNFFVVTLHGQTAAVAAIRPYDQAYEQFQGRYDAATAGVWRFFVDPEFAGLGLEALLQDRLEAFARAAGYNRLYAHDQREVPGAMRRYLDAGYRATYESPDPFGTVHFEKELA